MLASRIGRVQNGSMSLRDGSLSKRSLLAKAHSCTLGQHQRCLSVCRSSDRLEARWQQPRAVLQVQAESQKPAGRGVLRIRRRRMVWG